MDQKTEYHHYNIDRRPKRESSVSPVTPSPLDDIDKIDYAQVSYDATESAQNYDQVPTYPVRPHFHKHHVNMDPATQVVVYDGCPNDPYHPSSMPIYQTSTFVQPTASTFGPYDYTRSGNPTRTALETLVAGLENAYAAFAFTSGMAALSAVTRLVKPGDEILVSDDLYGGMYRLLTKVSSVSCGVSVKFADFTNLEEVEKAITPQTKLVHVETPTNPLMKVLDLKKISKITRERGIYLSVDSTMMTPLLQKPLALGADIVVHSGTKFFSGHSDATSGLVCVSTEQLAQTIAFFQNAEGTGLAPFECWLTLRGTKTMALRLERAQENAQKVAKFLSEHPAVKQINYPGLTEGGKVHNGQAQGPGVVLSFTTESAEYSRKFVNSLRLFKITVSFGSTNSLVEIPCLLSHASIPAHKRTIPESLLRMSVGIESANDIIADIKQAFERCEEPDF